MNQSRPPTAVNSAAVPPSKQYGIDGVKLLTQARYVRCHNTFMTTSLDPI
jgi:hypothetical protein